MELTLPFINDFYLPIDLRSFVYKWLLSLFDIWKISRLCWLKILVWRADNIHTKTWQYMREWWLRMELRYILKDLGKADQHIVLIFTMMPIVYSFTR